MADPKQTKKNLENCQEGKSKKQIQDGTGAFQGCLHSSGWGRRKGKLAALQAGSGSMCGKPLYSLGYCLLSCSVPAHAVPPKLTVTPKKAYRKNAYRIFFYEWAFSFPLPVKDGQPLHIKGLEAAGGRSRNNFINFDLFSLLAHHWAHFYLSKMSIK